jgi:hypothetical protein
LELDVERSEMEKKIREEEDFIHSPKFCNSLKRFLAKMENPPENTTIARLLLLSEEEVEKIYLESVAILRKKMLSK